MPNSDIAALGKQIRTARKKADLTQEQLSALCHVSTKHLANIEKGIMNPSYEILLAIFRVLPVLESVKYSSLVYFLLHGAIKSRLSFKPNWLA